MTPRMMLVSGAVSLGLAGVSIPGLADPSTARDLVVVTRGATLARALDIAVYQPFTAGTGQALSLRVWAGGLPALRNRIEAASGGAGSDDVRPDRWDLVMVDAGELQPGCDDGLFEKITWSAVGGRDHYLPLAVTDCGVGAAVDSLVLAWDREKFQGTPTWGDFWDVARYPGKRGLRQGARANLEIALMADGVSPGDVYRVLRSDEGLDRAFRKLDQIKPYLVWYDPEEQAARMLGSGEVLMTSAASPSIAAANRAGKHRFGLQWAGSLQWVLSWVIVKGSPQAADAAKLLSFAADPARQAAYAAQTSFGPAVKGAADLLPPDALAVSPSAPNNLAGGVAVDEQFWRDNGDKLNQRFQAWLAH